MKGNAIGTGTRNLSLNAPDDWALEVGRAASGLGLSLGEYLRTRVERSVSLEDPARAARMREIRKRYYGSILLLTFLLALAGAWKNPDELQRGCRRSTRPAAQQLAEFLELEAEEV